MLLVGSALKGFVIEADDGAIGGVHDCLFDQRTWTLRWLVVDTRTWLTGRKVLIHPSALGRPDFEHQCIPVHLTKARIEASPDLSFDLPVSLDMENGVYGYYGWDTQWGGSGYFASYPYAVSGEAALGQGPDHAGGDPNLRSMTAVNGYHIEATDGAIGHIENFILDDVDWDIRYLVVNTKNWWAGQHVLISPFAVRSINWAVQDVVLDVSRESVRGSPPWKPLDLVDEAYQKRLHGYYAWPGYGWKSRGI
jgi:hypothetical protein